MTRYMNRMKMYVSLCKIKINNHIYFTMWLVAAHIQWICYTIIAAMYLFSNNNSIEKKLCKHFIIPLEIILVKLPSVIITNILSVTGLKQKKNKYGPYNMDGLLCNTLLNEFVRSFVNNIHLAAPTPGQFDQNGYDICIRLISFPLCI